MPRVVVSGSRSGERCSACHSGMRVAGAILVGFGSSLDGIGPHGCLGKESAGTSIQRQPQAANASGKVSQSKYWYICVPL